MQTDEVRRAIEDNIARDPLQVALDKRLPHAALVASQVKYLQRARKKLPSYYEARCIMPGLAFEQSSGEQAAANKNYGGSLCIDLTCGLGVDSLALSKNFREVIAVERDATLAEAARINFGRLGARNIRVVNGAAEDFLRGFAASGRKADLIYIDPDRRSAEGKKQVRLEDCSPDAVALMPAMKRAAERIVVKASPLFDVDEAFRLFGPHCRVEVVSIANECKEVLTEVADDIAVPTICANAIGTGRAEFPYGECLPNVSVTGVGAAEFDHTKDKSAPVGTAEFDHTKDATSPLGAAVSSGDKNGMPRTGETAGGAQREKAKEGSRTDKETARTDATPFAPPYRYMIIPDVALRKARITAKWAARNLPGAFAVPNDGYIFLDEIPRGVAIMGRAFAIAEMREYSPRALKSLLRSRGIRSAEIFLHGFPRRADEICRDLGIREGGGARFAFTTVGATLWSIELNELPL